jgi:hypothetical protein
MSAERDRTAVALNASTVAIGPERTLMPGVAKGGLEPFMDVLCDCTVVDQVCLAMLDQFTRRELLLKLV